MSSRTFIHVGFPKCASTALQETFFATCRDISYVGRRKYADGGSGHEHLLRLATLDDLAYEQVKGDIQCGLLASFNDDAGKVRVISDELLVSTYRPYLSGIPVADRRSIVFRLREVFPEAHILMIVRNQLGFVASMISQLMRNNRTTFDIEQFVDSHLDYMEHGCGSFFLLADYYSVFRMYEKAFGEGGVHVMPLELLTENPEDFMRQLVELLGLSGRINSAKHIPSKLNQRATAFEIWCKRHPRLVRHIKKGLPSRLHASLRRIFSKEMIQPTFTQRQQQRLESFYGPGNQKLADATGLDLAAAGYPLPE